MLPSLYLGKYKGLKYLSTLFNSTPSSKLNNFIKMGTLKRFMLRPVAHCNSGCSIGRV